MCNSPKVVHLYIYHKILVMIYLSLLKSSIPFWVPGCLVLEDGSDRWSCQVSNDVLVYSCIFPRNNICDWICENRP